VPAPLSSALARRIRSHGLRNSHLTAIAPAGSISLLAGCVSSGVEPLFDWCYSRCLTGADGMDEMQVTDYAISQWRALCGAAPLPGTFVRGREMAAADQLQMVAALQPWVDSGISKTLALHPGESVAAVDALYWLAYRAGLKGMTVFPADAARGAVLGAGEAGSTDRAGR
jgi:ribonucleoside-diphosphate reductase alpha chain